MSEYYYENGAIHHDNHKEFTMNIKSVDDAKLILRELLKDNADETDYEEVDSENGHDNSEEAGNDDLASRVRKATEVMREERILKHKYDYAFIKMYMDEISDYPKFKSTQDFLDFLIDAGCKNVPGKSTFDAYYDKKAISKGEIKVKDDIVEEKRRNGIVKRFKELME